MDGAPPPLKRLRFNHLRINNSFILEDGLGLIDGALAELDTRVTDTETVNEGQAVTIATLQAGVSTLETGLAAELVARAAGDSALQVAIDAAAVTNAAADSAMQIEIDAEEVARAAADTALDGRLDTLEGQTLDARLDTLEGQTLDARLDTLEAQNLNTRLSVVEAIDYEGRISALEGWVNQDVRSGASPTFTTVNGQVAANLGLNARSGRSIALSRNDVVDWSVNSSNGALLPNGDVNRIIGASSNRVSNLFLSILHWGADTNVLTFSDNTNSRYTIDDSAFLPTVDAVRDLGSLALKFDGVYGTTFQFSPTTYDKGLTYHGIDGTTVSHVLRFRGSHTGKTAFSLVGRGSNTDDTVALASADSFGFVAHNGTTAGYLTAEFSRTTGIWDFRYGISFSAGSESLRHYSNGGNTYSFTGCWTGGGGANTALIQWERIGFTVTMHVEPVTYPAAVLGQITASVALPVAIWPWYSVTFPMMVISNSVEVTGSLVISAGGTWQFRRGLTPFNFAATGTAGWPGQSFTWMVSF